MNEGDSSKGKQGRRLWRSRANLIAAALALAGCAGAPAEKAPAEAQQREDVAGAAEDRALFGGIPQRGIVLGRQDAPVELIELSDLQCPFCRDFALGVLPILVDRYVRTGRLRLIFHNLPILGEQSQHAARLAVAVSRQDRMWQLVDLLFRNQGREGSGYLTDDFLRRVAGSVPDVDVDRAMREIDSPAVTDGLARAERIARELGVPGRTPSFVLRRTGEKGRLLRVQIPGDATAFVDAIDDVLSAR